MDKPIIIANAKLQELKDLMAEYQVIKTTNVHDGGNFLKIKTSHYHLANGKMITREEVLKKDAVTILPVTNDKKIIFVIQPRPLTKRGVTVELPAGYIDLGESSIDAASRELMEETGYYSSDLISLGGQYQDQGCCRSTVELFLAKDVVKIHEQQLDHDEYIKIFECSYEEALDLIKLEYIVDANTIIALFKGGEYINEDRSLCRKF